MDARSTRLTSRWRRPFAILGAWIGLLASGAALGAVWLHVDWTVGTENVSLLPSTFTPNGGHAYTVVLETDMPSDKDGESDLRLLENGHLLKPHASHTDIREKGGGLYSHWGKHLYFSASDSGDPRSNKRIYEVVVPGSLESRSDTARLLILGGLAAGVVALLCALLAGSGGVLALLLRVACVAVVAASALTASQQRTWWVMGDAIRTEAARFDELASERADGVTDGVPDDEPSAHAAAHARTRRLFAIEDVPAFTASAPALVMREPLRVPLVPGSGVDPGDGAHVLRGGQVLVNADALSLTVPDMASLVLRARVEQGDQIRITFLTDDPKHESPSFVLPVSPSQDWQTIRIDDPLERGVLVSENLVTGVHHIVGVELGPATTAQALVIEAEPLLVSDALAVYTRATHGSDSIERDRSIRPALWQSVAGSFEVPLPGGPATLLKGSVAVLGETTDGPVVVAVQSVGPHGETTTLHAQSVQPGGPWSEFRIPITPELARDDHSLVMTCASLPPGAVVAWSGLRLIDATRAPNRVVLMVIDTLRADALSCYGNATTRTPTLDRLAAEGARFARCFSQAHWTRPSMPSLMTGRYVASTGVTTGGDHLAASYETLAEAFAAGGFHTVAFVTNSHVGPANGLEQGLDEMLLDSSTYDTGLFLSRHATPRLEHLLEEDLFAWIHLMEVHGPYGPSEPPTDWVEPVNGTPVERAESFDPAWHQQPTAEGRVLLYHHDLESLDESLGSFLDEWLPRWETGHDGGRPVLLAVATDHGELLGEGGHWGHLEPVMTPALVHVPLIIRAPGRIAPGTVWEEPVENLDVGATLLDLSGVRPWRSSMERADQGHSLMPLLDGGVAADRYAVAISAVNPMLTTWGTLSIFDSRGGLIGKDGRLIGTVSDGSSTIEPLPAAETLATTTQGVVPEFRRAWISYLRSQTPVAEAMQDTSADATMHLDSETLEQMRALGYLGGH